MTEKDLQVQVQQLAKLGGWDFYHTWQSIHSTPGFPDCCLVKQKRLIFAELKTELGRITQRQQRWLDLLVTIPGVEVYLWRPQDFEEIKKVLLQQ